MPVAGRVPPGYRDKVDQHCLAVSQHGVLTAAQLSDCGLTRSAVSRRVAAGTLHPVHRGVYSIAPPELLSRYGRWMAAVLACGPGAALSHRSAAALHDLRQTDRAAIEVIVPGTTTRTHRGIQVHRSTTLAAQDITVIDGIPVTTVARTLMDLAAVLPRRAVERALDHAAQREVLDLTRVYDVIDRNRHSKGARRLKRILADYLLDAPTENNFEELFLKLCRDHNLPLPERQVYIDPDDGEPIIRGDFVWREQRLIVETDGRQTHGTHGAFESDRRRDQRLTLAGWRVLRITWKQLTHEPKRIARIVAQALRQRSW
jgi:predicted transcriptional regulator of viral defense system